MSNKTFKQDLSNKEDPKIIFMVKLLFKEHAEIPEKNRMEKKLKEHLGNIDLFWHDEKGAGVSAKDHICHFKDADVPPQFMIAACTEFDSSKIDDFHRSQFWDCNESDRILSECKYQIIATDMLAAALEPLERANMDMDFLEALVELFPECEALYFINSEKLYLADEIRMNIGKDDVPRNSRYIKYAVNVRFFNIEGTEGDMIVDTMGMSTLFLPDLQYHYHDIDPNHVVYHAKCTASYILDNNNPIKEGDPIDSINRDGNFDQKVMWKCSYESSLIQPVREVIDICMNEYAAGQR